jgi:hypothetical protein
MSNGDGMRAGLIKRVSVLEKARKDARNEKGQILAEVLRERFCRVDAELTGRSFDELISASREESRLFWANYTGDRSIAGVLRSRFRT